MVRSEVEKFNGRSANRLPYVVGLPIHYFLANIHLYYLILCLIVL